MRCFETGEFMLLGPLQFGDCLFGEDSIDGVFFNDSNNVDAPLELVKIATSYFILYGKDHFFVCK